MGKTIKTILPTVATVAGAYFGGPVGAAAGNSLAHVATGDSLSNSLKSGALTYGGSEIGGAIGDKLGLGTIGSNFGSGANVENNIANAAGNFIGQDSANALGGVIANTGIGTAAGGFAGNSLADSLSPSKTEPSGVAPFSPVRADQQNIPESLKGFGSLDANQQASNIATQGVYGQGNGPEEQGYFNNLINRTLVDPTGKVNDISSLSPIDNSYLQKLGLGGYSNSNDLLEAMSKWKAA